MTDRLKGAKPCTSGLTRERGCGTKYARPLLLGLLALAAVLILLAAGGTTPAYAATITVNTADDELNVDGDCSLREAIQAANSDAAVDACTAGSGADTIDVPAGTYTLSIARDQTPNDNEDGDLDITGDLTITGAGAATTIIDGAGLDKLFHIDPLPSAGITVEISGLTIQNGSSLVAGGIRNSGTLTLTSSTVNGNSSVFLGGGGIVNGGTLTLINSTVSGNFSNDFGGGISNGFGASATLTNSTVSGNTADEGGGILNSGTLTLTSSTVSGNTASGFGGGGISNVSAGTLTLNNSTVNGNTASAFVGGGIVNSGTLTLNSSTVSGNTASAFGGGIRHTGGSTSLKNTIVANSTAGGDCFGSITSAGHNLDSDGTCSFTATGDLQNTDPMLGPLADNGGPTFTHALLAGSPAIDAGSPDCPPPDTDQRGVARPQGAACDIGAYEFEPTVTPTPVDIDIKPGGDPNSINLHRKGVIPVAILTTPVFDATIVDADTVQFGPGAATKAHKQAHVEDVEDDGDLDVVLHFRTQDADIASTDTEACLTGETFDGQQIEGCDSVRVVP